MTHMGTLKNSDMFQDLPNPVLETIAELADTVNFEEGDNIYQLGDDANDLYLLESGRIRFSMGVGNRPEGSGSVILPGSVFGWAALLEDQPRRVATASCLEDSTVGVIKGAALLELFDNEKTAGYFVMRRLATMIARDFMSVLSV
jgi:CRP-like cAMP-binding protein